MFSDTSIFLLIVCTFEEPCPDTCRSKNVIVIYMYSPSALRLRHDSYNRPQERPFSVTETANVPPKS